MTQKRRYKRILLKISGEALMGELKVGLHPPTVTKIAHEIKKVHEQGVEAVSYTHLTLPTICSV